MKKKTSATLQRNRCFQKWINFSVLSVTVKFASKGITNKKQIYRLEEENSTSYYKILLNDATNFVHKFIITATSHISPRMEADKKTKLTDEPFSKLYRSTRPNEYSIWFSAYHWSTSSDATSNSVRNGFFFINDTTSCTITFITYIRKHLFVKIILEYIERNYNSLTKKISNFNFWASLF